MEQRLNRWDEAFAYLALALSVDLWAQLETLCSVLVSRLRMHDGLLAGTEPSTGTSSEKQDYSQ